MPHMKAVQRKVCLNSMKEPVHRTSSRRVAGCLPEPTSKGKINMKCWNVLLLINSGRSNTEAETIRVLWKHSVVNQTLSTCRFVQWIELSRCFPRGMHCNLKTAPKLWQSIDGCNSRHGIINISPIGHNWSVARQIENIHVRVKVFRMSQKNKFVTANVSGKMERCTGYSEADWELNQGRLYWTSTGVLKRVKWLGASWPGSVTRTPGNGGDDTAWWTLLSPSQVLTCLSSK